MYSTALMMAIVDLLSLALLFWVIPFTLAKLAARRLAGRTIRPVEVLLKELPGIVSGLAIGAIAVYAFGVSFEEFAVRHARTMGMKGMEIAGVGPISRCKARLIEEHKLDPMTFKSRMNEIEMMAITLDERGQIYAHARAFDMVHKDSISTQELIDMTLTDRCNKRPA